MAFHIYKFYQPLAYWYNTIIWLVLWANIMYQIVCCDCMVIHVATVSWPIKIHSCPIRKWGLECHIQNPSLTKLVKSTRWLDVGLSQFRVSLYIHWLLFSPLTHRKRFQPEYLAILTNHVQKVNLPICPWRSQEVQLNVCIEEGHDASEISQILYEIHLQYRVQCKSFSIAEEHGQTWELYCKMKIFVICADYLILKV